MFWALKRTVSLRWFKTYVLAVKTEKKSNNTLIWRHDINCLYDFSYHNRVDLFIDDRLVYKDIYHLSSQSTVSLQDAMKQIQVKCISCVSP